jgi:hypothetical protein
MNVRRFFLVPLVLVAALVLTLSAGAARSRMAFVDRAGDGAGEPDVTGLVISHDDNGRLTFAVKLADPALLAGENHVSIFIDSAQNANGTGARYQIGLTADGQSLARYDGTMYVDVAASTLARLAPTTLTISNRDLGGMRAFNVYLVTSGEDFAPDFLNGWSYSIDPKRSLEAVSAAFKPAAPRAGKVFRVASVALGLGSGQSVRPTSFRCDARLAGKYIPGCRWLVPTNAAKKRLVITITATYQGLTQTFRPYSFRVRE